VNCREAMLNLYPSVAPPGKHAMACFVQYAPYELAEGTWDDQREAFGDAVQNTIARYAPDFPSLVLHRQVLTPLDIERTFGLTEGWWKFTDSDLRATHALLSRGQWMTVLGQLGFSEAAAFPDVERGEGDGWQIIGTARGPVIDTETGLIFSEVFFDHNGQTKEYTQPDGTVVPINAPFTHPLTFEIAEIFKIKSGKIRQIEALINQVPYRMPSGWSN